MFLLGVRKMRRKIRRYLGWLHLRSVQATEIFMRIVTGRVYPSVGIGSELKASYYVTLPARIRLSLEGYPGLRDQAFEYAIASLEHELLHHILLREEGLKAFFRLDKVNWYNSVVRRLVWKGKEKKEGEGDKT